MTNIGMWIGGVAMLSLLALDYNQENIPYSDEKVIVSSATRGCQVKQPKIMVERQKLAAKNPVIKLRATEAGHEILMSIYEVDDPYNIWKTSTVSQREWQTLESPFRVEKGRRYAFALAVPCKGDQGAGESIFEVFMVN